MFSPLHLWGRAWDSRILSSPTLLNRCQGLKALLYIRLRDLSPDFRRNESHNYGFYNITALPERIVRHDDPISKSYQVRSSWRGTGSPANAAEDGVAKPVCRALKSKSSSSCSISSVTRRLMF
jgi:hypothetical protein